MLVSWCVASDALWVYGVCCPHGAIVNNSVGFRQGTKATEARMVRASNPSPRHLPDTIWRQCAKCKKLTQYILHCFDCQGFERYRVDLAPNSGWPIYD